MSDSLARFSRRFSFHPLIVILVSLSGAFLYALWATWRFSGDKLANQYLYVVPIVVPFLAFLIGRVRCIPETNKIGFALDLLVVGTAMMRVIGDVPYVSGHALFLTYAALGPGTRSSRITAVVVWIEVLYLKFFVWHDLITPITGMTLGAIMALIAKCYGTHPADSPSDWRNQSCNKSGR